MATNIVVTDVVPSGLTYVASSVAGGNSHNDADPAGAGLSWVVSSLASGSSTSLTFQAMVDADQGGNTITNTVSKTQSGTDTDVTADSPSVDVSVNVLPSAVSGPVNDTGITTCSDFVSNGLPCPKATYPGQDAEYGRDIAAQIGTLTKIGAGRAGFDFTKLDVGGNSLSATATSWSCVRDNFTGLVWEVKTDDGGLRDKNNTFAWYNPDVNTNGGGNGEQNGGICTGGINCDTYSYVQAANNQNLCGFSDWRLPWQEELRSIVDYDYSLFANYMPTIDAGYFPGTLTGSLSDAYWSASPEAALTGYAWCVDFYDGRSITCDKFYHYQARLVRGQ